MKFLWCEYCCLNKLLVTLFLSLLPLLTLAETDKAIATAAVVSTKTPVVVPTVGLGSSITVLLSLLIVVALIFGLAWFMKRIGIANTNNNTAMKVVATMALSTKDKLTIVEVGDKQILLGVSPGRINTLHVFDEKVVSVNGDAKPVFQQFLNAAKNKPQQGKDDE